MFFLSVSMATHMITYVYIATAIWINWCLYYFNFSENTIYIYTSLITSLIIYIHISIYNIYHIISHTYIYYIYTYAYDIWQATIFLGAFFLSSVQQAAEVLRRCLWRLGRTLLTWGNSWGNSWGSLMNIMDNGWWIVENIMDNPWIIQL